MAKNNISHSLIQRIFVLLLVTTSFVIGTTAESKQQGVFLDTKGNPISNDVLLALSSGSKGKPNLSTGSRGKRLDNKKIKSAVKTTPFIDRG